MPLGYSNVITKTDGHEIRGVVVDPERAPLVQWAFAAYASGEYSIVELLEEVTRRGLTNRPTATRSGKALTRSQLHRTLSSRYYVGKVFWAGVEYEGQHEALLDLATFSQVQAMLGSRRLAGDRSWKHDHYLKGSLRCERCGSRIAYGISTGKAGGKYPYFFCLGRAKKRTDCDLPSLSVDAVEQKVAEHWQDIAMPTEMAQRVRVIVTEMIEEQAASGAALLKSQTIRLTKLERTRQKLIDAYLAEAISTTDLKQRQEALASEQQDAERLLGIGQPGQSRAGSSARRVPPTTHALCRVVRPNGRRTPTFHEPGVLPSHIRGRTRCGTRRAECTVPKSRQRRIARRVVRRSAQ